jgi:hypothetical protein
MEKKSKVEEVVLEKKTNFQVLGQRVLVLPIPTKVEETPLILLEETKEKMKRELSNVLLQAEVISVGEEVTKVGLGDIVYVFPNQMEADIVIGGYTYLIYPERVLMGKVLMD